MPSYLGAWKTFRKLSKENEAIAHHLVSHHFWPKKDAISICDLGCGDGRLLESIVVQSPCVVEAAVLVDPDESLLREATQNIEETGLSEKVSPILAGAEDVFPSCAGNVDVALLVHVAYLMHTRDLKAVVESTPEEIPLFVVIDATESVFSSLWRTTAPVYHARAEKAHELLRSLASSDSWDVCCTEFVSTIASPLRIRRTDLRNAVLSLLCYASAESFDEPTLTEVRRIVQKFEVDGELRCTSSCYAIRRPSG